MKVFLVILAALVFAVPAFTQQRDLKNMVSLSFDRGLKSAHSFGEERNGEIYQLDVDYARRIFARRLFSIQYAARMTPLAEVRDRRCSAEYVYGAGASPFGLRMIFNPRHRFEPFGGSGGGFLYFQRPMFGTSLHFNFTAYFEGGGELFLKHRSALDFGYRYFHISNANLVHPNPGMGSHTLFAGMSFFW